jgi:hypothetical protein
MIELPEPGYPTISRLWVPTAALTVCCIGNDFVCCGLLTNAFATFSAYTRISTTYALDVVAPTIIDTDDDTDDDTDHGREQRRLLRTRG